VNPKILLFMVSWFPYDSLDSFWLAVRGVMESLKSAASALLVLDLGPPNAIEN
jgi:hypothetical protein